MSREIERKYLIRCIAHDFLRAQPGCAVWEIEQTYLTAAPGETRRVRRIAENGTVRYALTVKRRLSAMSSEEDEQPIDAARYQALLAEADPARRTIVKTRYRVPSGDQIAEIDSYPFWSDRMVLEIELASEAETPRIPAWVHVVREVTDDPHYKNVSLAAEIPLDPID